MNSTHDLITENAQLKQRIKLLEEMLRLQRQQRFGASSEKGSDEQGQIFNEAEEDALNESSDDNVDIVVPAHTRKKKKRVCGRARSIFPAGENLAPARLVSHWVAIIG